tara:strand:- start:235 stop:660 length:426 start_codon:yes stop_codon:yes gene_type:complete
MTQYHLKYTRIKPAVVKLVKYVIKDLKFFKVDNRTRKFFLRYLNYKLNDLYKIDLDKQPYLNFNANNDGFYNQIENTINLNERLSLITYLHEFKHFLQHHFNKTNNEEIARGYSLSLFFNASPQHFKRALRKGLILHQTEL